MARRLSIVYVPSLLVFSFMESSILTIFYIFSFCLVFKLYKSSLQNLQFISGHLIFLGSVDIGGYLIVTLFERWILTLAHFSDVFFLTCKLYMSGLCIIPYLGHGQRSVWGFLLLTFIESASLTTFYFFWWFFMISEWRSSGL